MSVKGVIIFETKKIIAGFLFPYIVLNTSTSIDMVFSRDILFKVCESKLNLIPIKLRLVMTGKNILHHFFYWLNPYKYFTIVFFTSKFTKK